MSQAATDEAVKDLIEVRSVWAGWHVLGCARRACLCHPRPSIRRAARSPLLPRSHQAEINDHDDPKPSSEDAVTDRPSRKVVDPPGGKQSYKLYGEEYEEADALSLAPPKDGGPGVDVDIDRMEHLKVHVEPEADGGARIEDMPDENKIELIPGEQKDEPATADARNTERESNPPPNFRPTRKVREGESLAIASRSMEASA